MQYITFQVGEKQRLGLKQENVVIDIKELSAKYNGGEASSFTTDMLSFIQAGDEAQAYTSKLVGYLETNGEVASSVQYKAEDVKVLAPISNPGKVICVGNNYMDHCREQNVEPPKSPMIFSKWASCIIGPDDVIELPEESEQVDYEAELVVIIGKKGKDISEEEAFDHIFGYTIMNDVSARDVQFADVQWVRGKSYDTFAPLGPVIVSKEEIEDPGNLTMKLDINGEVLQDSNTHHMIFDIPYIISYLSKGFTFEPGDVIATGTPHGVGVFRNPPVFLKKGDTCTIEVEKIGTLTNTVK
ncbi:fumarylacetoacetate hydrolase family protein [Alkalihalobacillus sp. MEB130]|uniref:fumarylacetoacetate hydrolase family protein n=1 Tax=Alkalihalobacillus sp. MEB130 TaxID=2976704 RepID=UPI0028DDB1B6|nr:fumarylacetoacetate hydrolase family protein [Alkalihalobacillus sp. MEB130]MDT8860349.1 fumarylacetoacetate hydrolase family protein [Alkalihalobacillus sp. MEB130]